MGGRCEGGRREEGRFDGAVDGAFDAGRLDGGALAGTLRNGGALFAGGELGAVLGGALGGALGAALGGALGASLFAGGALGARELGVAAALFGGAGLDPESGRTLGLFVSGNRTLMTCAMDPVAVSTPGCSLFTSCRSASVWLKVPRAFLTQVFPSTSVDAYSASKSAPTERAIFCAMPRTSLGMFSSC